MKARKLNVFATLDEQSEQLGWLRVFADDVAELSAVVGNLLALHRHVGIETIEKRMNEHPDFWGPMLLALQTNMMVVIGRLFDIGRRTDLKSIMSFAASRKQLASEKDRFDRLATEHKSLIENANKMRNNVFAHSSQDRKLHVAFGFRDMTLNEVEELCRKLISASDLLASAIFEGSNFGPRLKQDQLDCDIALASDAWSALFTHQDSKQTTP